MKIAVIGMGKIGLPLAVQYARKGHDVIGVDINEATIEAINQGVEPFPEEANLQKYLSEVIASKRLKASLSYEEAVSNANVIVVVVPLFIKEDMGPDFRAIDSATKNVGKYIKEGALVCYETTLPIGTTRARLVPALEAASNLKVGQDFSVVFSPERVFTGRIFQDLRSYPKIVGGVTEKCTQEGLSFYNKVLDFDERVDLNQPNGVWAVQSAESAEFVKLAETTYRDVNIALANQFAIYADKIGVNIYEVINASNSQRYSNIHQPGVSVGGHCIPIYPNLYLWNDRNARLIQEARHLNANMPKYAVEKLKSLLGNMQGREVLIVGVSYRPNVKETFLSGAIEIDKLLRAENVVTSVYDPLYTLEELEALGLKQFDPHKKSIDVVILHVLHSKMTNDIGAIIKDANFIFDGRNYLQSQRDLFPQSIVLGSGK